jgi:hypothetical protein
VRFCPRLRQPDHQGPPLARPADRDDRRSGAAGTAPAPADLTDAQLQQAIHDVGATLLNRHGPVLQDCLARYGATLGDPRFPAALPATIRSRVLTMIIQAYDSSGLALLGLREHATASALGPVRNVAKTYAYTKWLLESPDENVRLGRVYRLAVDAIDQVREQKRTLDKLAPGSELTLRVAPMLGAGAERMSDPNSWRSTCWSRAATCSIHCCPTQASTRARYAVRPLRQVRQSRHGLRLQGPPPGQLTAALATCSRWDLRAHAATQRPVTRAAPRAPRHAAGRGARSAICAAGSTGW